MGNFYIYIQRNVLYIYCIVNHTMRYTQTNTQSEIWIVTETGSATDNKASNKMESLIRRFSRFSS
jgi:hypothetical protein